MEITAWIVISFTPSIYKVKNLLAILIVISTDGKVGNTLYFKKHTGFFLVTTVSFLY